MSGEFAVIGLGQFGRAVVESLVDQGQSVLAIDKDPERAQVFERIADGVVVADATTEAALSELRLERMTCVVVAMPAKDTSIMVTALLRQRGAPRIVARAVNPLHARVLRTVGAHEVVSPERDMGERTARRLAQPHVLDQFTLDSSHVVAELELPAGLVGKGLKEVGLSSRYEVTPLLLRRGAGVIAAADLDGPLEEGDVLVVLGAPEKVRRVASLA